MYFESEYASVEWNERAGVAVLFWKKFASADDFRLPCRKALELGIKNGAVCWFSNTTELGVISDDDGAWFIQEIVAGMLENGIKRQALIIPENVIARMTLNKASDTAVEAGLETKYFKDTESAVEWLEQFV